MHDPNFLFFLMKEMKKEDRRRNAEAISNEMKEMKKEDRRKKLRSNTEQTTPSSRWHSSMFATLLIARPP